MTTEISNLSVTSPSTGTLRFEGTASDANRVEYLIQEPPGTTPTEESEPSGIEIVADGEPFTFDVEGLSPGEKRVWARARMALVGDRYVAPDGDDGADGLTRETAWATFERMSTDIALVGTGGVRSYVVMQGDYEDTGEIVITGGKSITLDFEPGVTVDNSMATVRTSGIAVTGAVNQVVEVNLRGAVFTGVTIGSGNGLGTSGAPPHFKVNGADDEGNKAIFQGYDDGVSFHGTVGAIDAVEINDCVFQDCNKASFAHVDDASGTLTRCDFFAKDNASLGVGVDRSSNKSDYIECRFFRAPSTSSTMEPGNHYHCQIGEVGVGNNINFGNFVSNDAVFEDCFINVSGDGPGSLKMTRCWGSFNFRIRGTAEQQAEFVNCIFVGRDANVSHFCNSNFFSDDGNWLGGTPIFRNCIIIDHDRGFYWHTTDQRDWMNANWTLENSCMFNNTLNFRSGLTIGDDMIFVDPQLGSRATVAKEDWGFLPGSPCIGAGKDGADIGFAAT